MVSWSQLHAHKDALVRKCQFCYRSRPASVGVNADRGFVARQLMNRSPTLGNADQG